MKLYLARHATPDWGRNDLPYHLPPGPPLTAQGRAEAEELGRFLKEAGVRRLYASPLERCLDTARLAAEVCGASVEVFQGLMEWQPDEDHAALWGRMRPVFEQACLASATDGPLALVTHGGPIAALLKELGMDEDSLNRLRIFDHRNLLPPAGVWEASRSTSDEAWSLKLVFTPQLITPWDGYI